MAVLSRRDVGDDMHGSCSLRPGYLPGVILSGYSNRHAMNGRQ
jgi:hypothetical protein